MVKDLNKLERVLDTLQTQSMMLMFQDKKEESDDIEQAIKLARYGVALANKDELLRHFMIFETRNWRTLEDFIDDHTYICHHMGIAVRKFNGQYYAVKIMNPDDCFSGILTTDAPDNYPMHCFPETIIHSEYPEIAMLKVIEEYHRQEEQNSN